MKYKGLSQLSALLIAAAIIIYYGGLKLGFEANQIIEQQNITIVDLESRTFNTSSPKMRVTDLISNGEILKALNNVLIEKFTPYIRSQSDQYIIVGANMSMEGSYKEIIKQIQVIEDMPNHIIIQSINFETTADQNHHRRLIAKLIIEQLIYS